MTTKNGTLADFEAPGGKKGGSMRRDADMYILLPLGADSFIAQTLLKSLKSLIQAELKDTQMSG